MDIGCGCSELPGMLARHALARGGDIVLIDSAEMLAALPADVPGRRAAGRFPDLPELRAELAGRATAVVVYSVLQYVLAGGDLHGFVDAAVAPARAGRPPAARRHPERGEARRGSSRRRPAPPTTAHSWASTRTRRSSRSRFGPGAFDDGILLGLLLRYRQAGFESYLVPQGRSLPMQNRREDLLIVRN